MLKQEFEKLNEYEMRREGEHRALQKFLFSLCLIVVVGKRHNNSNKRRALVFGTPIHKRGSQHQIDKTTTYIQTH